MVKRSRTKFSIHVKNTTLRNNLSILSAASQRCWITAKKDFKAALEQDGGKEDNKKINKKMQSPHGFSNRG